MARSSVGGPLLLAAVVASIATTAVAQEVGGRKAPVLATKIDLQQRFDEWLGRSLAALAVPYRVSVSTRIEVRGDVREVVERDETLGSEMTIKNPSASRSVTLPGLGTIEKTPDAAATPDIKVTLPGRRSAQVRRELETEVTRIGVRIFVSADMPADRRASLSKHAAELAGLDAARGDTVEILEMAAAAPPPQQLALGDIYPWTLASLCGTALLSAIILGLALVRAGALSRASATTRLTGGGPPPADVGAAAAGVAAKVGGSLVVSHGEGGGAGRPGLRVLDGVREAELAEVLAALSPDQAAILLDRAELPPAALGAVFDRLPRERQLELARALGASRSVPVTAVEALEREVAAALVRIRSQVAVGGPGRLADLIALAPESVQREILADIAARAPEMATAVRGELLLLEDLPALPVPVVRKVVTSLEPAVVAHALSDAPAAVRDAVHRAVSKRLRTILVEEERVGASGPEAVEAARKQVEAAMRAVHPGRLQREEAA